MLEQSSLFKVQISELVESLNLSQQTPVEPNWRLWVKLSPDHLIYLRNLFKKKRICATHILVFMVADERRNSKPYAIPILYVPYKGIRDQEVRDLTKKIKTEMTNAHLKVVGKSNENDKCCWTAYHVRCTFLLARKWGGADSFLFVYILIMKSSWLCSCQINHPTCKPLFLTTGVLFHLVIKVTH